MNTIRSAIALLLMCACTAAAASSVPSHGANGNGGSCPEMTAAKAQAEQKASSLQETSERGGALAPAGGGKPAAARESGTANTRMQAPRWHSFLPGMFR